MTEPVNHPKACTEKPIVFNVNDKPSIAIYHKAHCASETAVVIVVGGPQTRVGSHRQFVLLAREMAKQGVDVLRFDYSGAGDSEGDIKKFTELSSDIKAAIETLLTQNTKIKNINLWGLCDAASAILLYLAQNDDPRIKQLTLLNPWVRQPATEAQTYLRSYYVNRLFQRSFWQKIFKGKFKVSSSINDIKQFKIQSKQSANSQSFVSDMLESVIAFNGKIHFILSENDLTANEFKLLISTHPSWKKLITQANINVKNIPLADHTFSCSQWHETMVDMSIKNIS